MMTLGELQALAEDNGIQAEEACSVVDVIRAIQHREGNFPCCGTATLGVCDQPACRWRETCFHESACATVQRWQSAVAAEGGQIWIEEGGTVIHIVLPIGERRAR